MRLWASFLPLTAKTSRDGSRTWLMGMIYPDHRDQAASIQNATTIRGHDSLNRTTINMPQPMPSGVIQETIRTASLPIMTGIAVSQAGTDHQDVKHKFRAFMNATRRASISNMTTLPGRAPMPREIRCFGHQPSCQNPSELDRSRVMYDIQEVDVADSIILDMWG